MKLSAPLTHSRRLLAAALCLCSAATAVPVLPELSSCGGFRVAPASQRFVDGCGRERYFRGVNKVEKWPPYVSSTLVFAAGDSLTPGDGALQQSLGFNALRLGVMWAGAAPTRGGGFSSSYLNALADISRVFADDYGVATLADAHQDTLSEAFCDDGAPIWLAHDMAEHAPMAFPLPIGEWRCEFGPDGRPSSACCSAFSGWADIYGTSAVSFAFQQLYTNATFADQYAAFLAAVAEVYAPLLRTLVGIELMNEPWAGDVLADPLLLLPGVADLRNLQPFYTRVAAAIRRVAPTGPPLFAEGVTWDDVFPLGFTSLPDADAGLAAVSYHYYDLPGLDFALDIAQRAADMQRLHAGGLLTEFAMYGFCPNDLSCMRRTLDTLEEYSHGYLGWEYATLWNGSSVIDARAYEMARPFPLAVGGTGASYAFNRAANSFTLNFTVAASAPAAATATVVFASLGLYYPRGFTATLATAPADAVHSLALPCWAGAGPGGAVVAPPAMACAPAEPPATPGAPPPYAFGYAVLTLSSQTGGAASLHLSSV